MHVVLLGDSVFDNGVYVPPGQDVPTHLRALLGDGARVTLLAIDGSTTDTVHGQIPRVPADATHVVLSIGGNDALDHLDLLATPARHAGQVLDLFGEAVELFRIRYEAVLAALPTGPRRLACTVYNGALDPRDAPRAKVALMLFDDTIVRTALRYGVDVIELRAVCAAPGDFTGQIEPSVTGGPKIARAVAAALTGAGGPRLHGPG